MNEGGSRPSPQYRVTRGVIGVRRLATLTSCTEAGGEHRTRRAIPNQQRRLSRNELTEVRSREPIELPGTASKPIETALESASRTLL